MHRAHHLRGHSSGLASCSDDVVHVSILCFPSKDGASCVAVSCCISHRIKLNPKRLTNPSIQATLCPVSATASTRPWCSSFWSAGFSFPCRCRPFHIQGLGFRVCVCDFGIEFASPGPVTGFVVLNSGQLDMQMMHPFGLSCLQSPRTKKQKP